METTQIEYILAIAKHRSISRASVELHLTQSALNQQLLKLEKELGAPLFIRTRNNWDLTDIGRLYIERANEIVQIKKETYDQIQDMAQRWNRTVAIGLTPERGIQLFTAIYPQIHALYPDTTFQPIEANVDSQNCMLDSGEIDFGFQTIYEHKYKHLNYESICYEPFYLCVPRSHPLAYQEQRDPGDYPVADLRNFKNETFTLVKKSSTMRKIIDRLFEKAGFQPTLLFESVSMLSMLHMAESEQCCSIVPRFYAKPDGRVAYYQLGDDARWEVCAAYAPNHHLTNAARDYIKMASSYWRRFPYGNL